MRLNSNNSTVGLQSLAELSNISEVKGALSSGETEVSFLANQLVQAQAKRPRIVKNRPAMQETQVRSLGQEDPLEEEMASPLQYSCLGNPMDREAWKATVHGVTKSWAQLNEHRLRGLYQNQKHDIGPSSQ